ncbi:MAG: DUF433 domain-containing protein [Candidatus Ranarchaeia archaeon]
MFDRITVDPMVMGGVPCIRDTRVPVSVILKLLAKRVKPEQILRDYPELEEADITACLTFASWTVSEHSLPVTP